MTRSSKDIRLPLIESSLHSESPSLSAEKTHDPFLVAGGVAKAPARRMSSIRLAGRKGSEWPSAGGDGNGAGKRWYDMLVWVFGRSVLLEFLIQEYETACRLGLRGYYE